MFVGKKGASAIGFWISAIGYLIIISSHVYYIYTRTDPTSAEMIMHSYANLIALGMITFGRFF